MTTCESIGYLTVGGRKVGLIQCTEDAGHEQPRPVYLDPHGGEVYDDGGLGYDITPLRTEPGTPHKAILTWETDVSIDWPEAYNASETFDTEVSFDAQVRPLAPLPEPVCDVEWYESRIYCSLPPDHEGDHISASSLGTATWPRRADESSD